LASEVAPERRADEPAGTRALGRRVLEVESNSVLIATVALIGVIGIAHPDFLAWGQLKEVVQNARSLSSRMRRLVFGFSERPRRCWAC
jgi:hypothetical protein